MAAVKTALKVHGGKGYLAKRIAAQFPSHRNYIEPYAGGLSVLLAKDPEGVSEVVNDLDNNLTIFWRVMQGLKPFEEFRRLCEATPFSECEWHDSDVMLTEFPEFHEEIESPSVRAWQFFIRCRQSLAGRGDSFSPISTSRTRRGMNEQASAWLSAIEGLPAIHERLKRVVILCRDALDVIRQFDGPETVVYADPPYCPTTRTSPNVYHHEMSVEDHEEFLDTVLDVEHANVAVSGYRCELYDDRLSSWRRVEWEIPNHAASGKQKRTMVECLWMNWR